MQKATHEIALERDRTAAQFECGAHLMKRTVSLSEVARCDWCMAHKQQISCKTRPGRIKVHLENENLEHSNTFIVFINHQEQTIPEIHQIYIIRIIF